MPNEGRNRRLTLLWAGLTTAAAATGAAVTSWSVSAAMRAAAEGNPPRPGAFLPPGLTRALTDVAESVNRSETDLREALLRERFTTLELELRSANLTDARRQLEHLNRELEAFTYSASHDLAVPLRTIGAFAELLGEAEDAELGPASRDYLERITHTAARMEDLISDLLVLSRMRADTDPEPEPIDLNTLLADIEADLAGSISKPFVVQCPRSLPIVVAPPQRVRVILQNLVQNAIKYSRRDPAVASVSGDDAGSFVSLAIIDNGVGISADEQDRIFELFARGSAGNGTTGTGAGLAIARRAARSLGGDLWLEDTSGRGSTFALTLPSEPPVPEPNVIDLAGTGVGY